ncbi:MAG: hypothetical protein AAGM38_17090 [Pseudomonadota bacterium]
MMSDGGGRSGPPSARDGAASDAALDPLGDRGLGAYQRDTREILASIRRLMGPEEAAAQPGGRATSKRATSERFSFAADSFAQSGESAAVSRDLGRSDARASRARAASARIDEPEAGVDAWPDDPEIDVDALAEELLREVNAMAEHSRQIEAVEAAGAPASSSAASSSAPATVAPGEPRPRPAARDFSPPSDAAASAEQPEGWAELETLLDFAHRALDDEETGEAVGQGHAAGIADAPGEAAARDGEAAARDGAGEAEAQSVEALSTEDATALIEQLRRRLAEGSGETRPIGSESGATAPLGAWRPAPLSHAVQPPRAAASSDADRLSQTAGSAPESGDTEAPAQASPISAAPPRGGAEARELGRSETDKAKIESREAKAPKVEANETAPEAGKSAKPAAMDRDLADPDASGAALGARMMARDGAAKDAAAANRISAPETDAANEAPPRGGAQAPNETDASAERAAAQRVPPGAALRRSETPPAEPPPPKTPRLETPGSDPSDHAPAEAAPSARSASETASAASPRPEPKASPVEDARAQAPKAARRASKADRVTAKRSEDQRPAADPALAAPTPRGGAAEPAPDDAPPADAEGPSADGLAAMRKLGDLVRARAAYIKEHDLKTYTGKQPHPRIADMVGFTYGLVGAREAEPADANDVAGAASDAAPPAPSQKTPTEAALEALDHDGAADAVEPRRSAGGGDAAMRRALAQWLEQNLPELLEDMVQKQLSTETPKG